MSVSNVVIDTVVIRVIYTVVSAITGSNQILEGGLGEGIILWTCSWSLEACQIGFKGLSPLLFAAFSEAFVPPNPRLYAFGFHFPQPRVVNIWNWAARSLAINVNQLESLDKEVLAYFTLK